MTARYGNHDMEDVPAPQDSAALDLVPPDHTIPRGGTSEESVGKLTLVIPWLSCQNNSSNLGPNCLLKICHPPTTHMPELM